MYGLDDLKKRDDLVFLFVCEEIGVAVVVEPLCIGEDLAMNVDDHSVKY